MKGKSRVIHKGVKDQHFNSYYLKCGAGRRGVFHWVLDWSGVTCTRCLREKRRAEGAP